MEEAESSENAPSPTATPDDPPAKACALCGCSTPAVRCDRCSSQTFCLSCDDMYHKHPKRKLHLRKAVDSIWASGRSPRLRRRTELPGDPAKIPIPPPRSKKRHTVVGGRMFFRPNHELGSFGHSKVDMRTISPRSRDVFAGQKSPMNVESTYENDSNISPNNNQEAIKPNDIYENENVTVNQAEHDNANAVSRSPWDMQRTNISSPIQVSIPSNSPDLMANGQSFGYPLKPQSRSIADLSVGPPNPMASHPYHFPHYPYMPPVHPHYSQSMSHLNCAQCLSSPWSNVMSPHPSPFIHPMPWGPVVRGPVPAANGQNGKHSQGNLAYMDSSFQYPYPGAPFFPNGGPEQQGASARERPESQGSKKSTPKQGASVENLRISSNPTPESGSRRASATPGPANANVDEQVPVIPKPPTEPWSCVHCTFINPPGLHICQVCCKTSYGEHSARSDEQQDEAVADNRYSDSPELVNMDALPQSPGLSGYKEAQQVI